MSEAALPKSALPLPRRRKKIDLLAWTLGFWVTIFMIFLLLPIVAVVVVSFSSASYIAFPMPGVSLRWYWQIVEYRPFMDALLVSIQLALASAVLAILLGVPAALWVARTPTPLASAIGNLLLAPLSIPAIVLGFSLLYLLSAMGVGISFTALLISHTVVSIPYIARTVLAVYRALPPDFEEAAAVLGATRWQTLRYTTLPLIRPGIFAGSLFSILISLDNLPLSFFFGTSATNTLPVVMLSYMQMQFDPSIAAISTVQMLIAVGTLLVLNAVYGVDKLTAA